ERLVTLRPGDPPAWGRLAEMAARDGDQDRLAELRRRKARIDRAVDDYRTIMGAAAAVDVSRAAVLARAAEVLGRRFEARGWWTVRARQQPEDREARAALARLAGEDAHAMGGARTLADLIPSSLAAPATHSSARTDARRVPIFR